MSEKTGFLLCFVRIQRIHTTSIGFIYKYIYFFSDDNKKENTNAFFQRPAQCVGESNSFALAWFLRLFNCVLETRIQEITTYSKINRCFFSLLSPSLYLLKLLNIRGQNVLAPANWLIRYFFGLRAITYAHHYTFARIIKRFALSGACISTELTVRYDILYFCACDFLFI